MTGISLQAYFCLAYVCLAYVCLDALDSTIGLCYNYVYQTAVREEKTDGRHENMKKGDFFRKWSAGAVRS